MLDDSPNAAAASGTTLSTLGLPTSELQAISFEDGLSTSGTLNTTNFWNWNDNNPATYGGSNSPSGTTFKAGSTTVGTPGTITYYFDPGSDWTAAEETGLKAAMQLWSDESGVSFVQASSAASADETFYRYGSTTPGNPAEANSAFTEPYYTLGTVNTTQAGSLTAGGYTANDTSAFGDVDSFSQKGGYGITTLVHELGHILGLGHPGPYNGTVDTSTQQNGPYDNRLYSIMSYIDVNKGQYPTGANWGGAHGYAREESTPMVDDILAIQQLYGTPMSGGLQGGQVFGFGCNITDGTQEFFDFTIDTTPVVTLYDAGTGNTLNLSGFSTANNVNLNPGTYSNVDGLTDNIGIAYGTKIDSFVGGSGNDTITLNMDADTIDGGKGENIVVVFGDENQYTITYLANGDVSLSGDGQSALLDEIQEVRFADGTVTSLDNAACYCSGTLIATDQGDVAVEALVIGDRVMTASGAFYPIKWIGQRTYSGRFIRGNKDILPICFKAGSLNDHAPRRDLWVSPHHAMYLDRFLVEAKDLVNGISIVQATHVERAEYFHIELESHGAILAEGAWSETFLDDDSRGMFHNVGEYARLYPGREDAAARYFAPRIDQGEQLQAIRRHLTGRAFSASIAAA